MLYFVTCWPNIWGKTWKRKERKSVLVFALRLPIIAKSGATLPKIEHFWNFQICLFCLSYNWFCQLEPWGRSYLPAMLQKLKQSSIIIVIFFHRLNYHFNFSPRKSAWIATKHCVKLDFVKKHNTTQMTDLDISTSHTWHMNIRFLHICHLDKSFINKYFDI